MQENQDIPLRNRSTLHQGIYYTYDTTSSENITLDLAVSPSEGSPINYNSNTGLNSWCDPYYLSIQTAAESGLTARGMEVGTLYISTSATRMITDADEFAVDSFTSGDAVTYQYAHYEPEGGSDTISERINRQNKQRCGILKQGDKNEEIYHNARRV